MSGLIKLIHKFEAMKNFLALLTFCLSMPLLTIAQETTPVLPEPEAEVTPIKFVVGLEGGYGVHNIKGPGIQNVGLTVDIPYKKFSFGTGILFKDMGEQRYMTYNGYSYTKKEDGETITISEFERHKVDLSYISVPLRVQMRLPCNCVYVQASLEIDFLKKGADQNYETIQMQGSTTDYMEENIVKDINYAFVVGVGFKLHESRRLRIFMRPEYEFMLSHIKDGTIYKKHDMLNRLKMSMGVQYGL